MLDVHKTTPQCKKLPDWPRFKANDGWPIFGFERDAHSQPKATFFQTLSAGQSQWRDMEDAGKMLWKLANGILLLAFFLMSGTSRKNLLCGIPEVQILVTRIGLVVLLFTHFFVFTSCQSSVQLYTASAYNPRWRNLTMGLTWWFMVKFWPIFSREVGLFLLPLPGALEWPWNKWKEHPLPGWARTTVQGWSGWLGLSMGLMFMLSTSYFFFFLVKKAIVGHICSQSTWGQHFMVFEPQVSMAPLEEQESEEPAEETQPRIKSQL